MTQDELIKAVADRAFRDGMAHAEAVAERLVEVIGSQHVALVAEQTLNDAMDVALGGRIAEVEALRESLDNLRAQIAADIEADKVGRAVDLCVGSQDAYNRAARIAREGGPA